MGGGGGRLQNGMEGGGEYASPFYPYKKADRKVLAMQNYI